VPPRRPPHIDGVLRGTDAVRLGQLTRAQLRGPAFRRLRQDVYCAADLLVTHRVQAEGVALLAPPEAVFGGLTAATLWSRNAPFAGPDDPVEVVLPPGVRWNPTPDVTVRTADTAGDVVDDGTLRWTDRVRTAVDLARRGPLDDAVVLLDQLVHAGVVRLDDVRAAVAELPRCRGSALARQVAAEADGLAQSPQETRLRLLMRRAGLPVPVAQYVVRHDRRFVAQVDFGFPEQKLAVEYDGGWHGAAGQLSKDRARMNRLLAAGWRILFVTAADMWRRDELVDRIAAALGIKISTR
jgi:very-short-patch-repair endonuclease